MELTSPLTTLTSLSTPTSFYTARGSQSNGADDTAISSPVDEQPPDLGQRLVYRDAVPLPRELKSHCQIHLEEQLYLAAIQILSGLLSDGLHGSVATKSSRFQPTPQLRPALVPPPNQLALLATLIIHPSFTTLPPETGNLHVASYALSYLRGLVSTVGPVNANLGAAFTFRYSSPSSHHSTRYGGAYTSDTASSDDSDDALMGKFARSQLVFHRGQNFWTVLAWAFRCAAEHPHRWRYWRVWLDLVVGAAEADLDDRLARDKEAGGAGRGQSAEPYPMLRESMIVKYLDDLRRERKNVLREVLRSLFAFLDPENQVSDRAQYREVFDRETLVGLRNKGKRKRSDDPPVVDLENDQFGDYLDEDSFGSEYEVDNTNASAPSIQPAPPPTQRRRGRPPKKPNPSTTTPQSQPQQQQQQQQQPALTDEIAETIPFRLRIFRLLSSISYHLSADLLASIDELYETFTDHVRGLPLPSYRLFVASHHLHLPEEVQIAYLRTLIESLLPPPSSGKRAAAAANSAARPDPADVDPDRAEAGMSPLLLRECYLPFAAARVTAEDNARLSLALESMLWYLYQRCEMGDADALRRAVERGIRAREDKIKKRAGGGDSVERAAREVLARSARSLRALADVVGLEDG